MSTPKDVPLAFLSYAREDSEFALKVVKDLRASGGAVWLDQLDIIPGQRWDRAVEEALEKCPRMYVVLSPNSVASTNVMNEVSYALEEGKVVVPILYRECKIPLQLRRVHYIDFRTDYGKGLAAMLKTLGVEEPAPKPAAVWPQAAVESTEPIKVPPTVAADMGNHPAPVPASGDISPQLLHKLVGHSQWVKRIAISPDGSLLASGGGVELWLWRVSDGNVQLKFQGHHRDPINGLAFSPDGTLLASTGNYIVNLWQVKDGKHVCQLIGGGTSVAFSPDGDLLASGSYYGQIFIWRCRDWKLLRKLEQRGDSGVSCLMFSLQGEWLASAGFSQVHLWQRSDWQTILVLNEVGGVNSVAITADASLLVSTSTMGRMRLWRLPEGENLLGKGSGWVDGFNDGALSTYGGLLAAAKDYKVQLLQIPDGKLICELATDGIINCVAFSADGTLLAAGSDAKTVRLWAVMASERPA